MKRINGIGTAVTDDILKIINDKSASKEVKENKGKIVKKKNN